MNIQKIIPTLLLFALCTALQAQGTATDSTGLPGDHLNLSAVLNLFKSSNSLEAFENSLNKEKSQINNLDLNEDGEVDYIRVVAHQSGDFHAIVLQVPINAAESQDVAIIEIEKTGKEQALLQIIGEEWLYGPNYIVEPFEESMNGGEGGPSATEGEWMRVVVNVWFWPSVRFVYRPGYRAWVSPWRWAYYPTWYRPWRPAPLRIYYPRTVVYRNSFHVVRTHRVVRAHRVYTPIRTYSPAVRTRTTTRVVRTNNGTVVSRNTTIKKRGASPTNKAVTTRKSTAVYHKNAGQRVSVSNRKTTVKGRNSQGAVRRTSSRTAVKKANGPNRVGVSKKKSTTVRRKRG